MNKYRLGMDYNGHIINVSTVEAETLSEAKVKWAHFWYDRNPYFDENFDFATETYNGYEIKEVQ